MANPDQQGPPEGGEALERAAFLAFPCRHPGLDPGFRLFDASHLLPCSVPHGYWVMAVL